ncbi:MAG: hypothetical protein ABIZ49_09655 [Opitutaceae bacterium]
MDFVISDDEISKIEREAMAADFLTTGEDLLAMANWPASGWLFPEILTGGEEIASASWG